MGTTDDIAELYDKSYDKYAKSNQGKQNAIPGGVGTLRTCVEIPSFLAALGDIQGRRILDAGCGEGNYSRAYKSEKKAARVCGVDITPNLIKAAAEREAREKLGIEYLTLDLSKRNETLEGQFDIVASTMVLMHLPSKESLQQAASNLAAYIDPKTGGRVLAVFVLVDFDVNERPDHWEPTYGWYWSKPANGRTYADGEKVEIDIIFDPSVGPLHLAAYMWSKKTYQSAFEEAGFENVKWIRPELSRENVKALGLTEDFFEPYMRLMPIWIISAEKPASH
jgi:SAM-dependent methyltransferase